MTKRPAEVPFFVISKNTKLGSDNCSASGFMSNVVGIENEVGAREKGVVLEVEGKAKVEVTAGNAEVAVDVRVVAGVGDFGDANAEAKVVVEGENAETGAKAEDAADVNAEEVVVEDGNAETGAMAEEGNADAGGTNAEGNADAGGVNADGNAEAGGVNADENADAGGANAEGKLIEEEDGAFVVDCDEDGEPNADL